MESLLVLLKDYGSQISIAGAVVAFLFGVYKFQNERREAHYWREFEVFHKLVKELVEPPGEGQSLFIDRQTAIMYELRYFKRYYPFSLRLLKGLRKKWDVPDQFERLIEEMNITIAFLEKNTKHD